MDAPPLVFDRPLARRRLARALDGAFADFLVERAAEDLAERLSAVTRPFTSALDLGTPTAAAARVLAGRGVTEVVRAAPARSPDPAGIGVVADEEALPFGPGSFDLVTSLLSLHAVNDLPGALLQIRGALRPDGLFLGCMFGGSTLTELRRAFTAAESETAGGASPRVAPMVEVRVVGSLLQRAGFALPVVDSEPVVVRYADMFGLLRDLRAMGATNVLVDRQKTPLGRSLLMRAAAIYRERFADPDERVRATFDLVWMSGWSPHESQPKPLRPGSATVRLADALGTTERSAGEGVKS